VIVVVIIIIIIRSESYLSLLKSNTHDRSPDSHYQMYFQVHSEKYAPVRNEPLCVTCAVDLTWAAAAVCLPYLLGEDVNTIIGTEKVILVSRVTVTGKI